MESVDFSWFLVSGCLLIFKFSFGFFIQLDDCLKVGCLLVIFLSYAKKEISEVAFFCWLRDTAYVVLIWYNNFFL